MLTLEGFRREWLSDSPFIEAHTSGSTGTPKPIRLLKSDMRSSAEATNTFFKLDSGSCLTCPLSLDYIAGKMIAVRAWLLDTEPLMIEPSNSPVLPPHSDLLAVVPSQVPSVIASVKSGKVTVSNLLIGGSALSEDLRKAILSEIPQVAAYESYGMTETCSHVALRRIGGDSLFHAMPSVSFETDSRNCLKVKLDRLSAQTLQTNDIVELITSTSFRWIGRYDNVINTGGLKVFPEQLEHEIKAIIPDIAEFYITSEPDTKWGNHIVMVIEDCIESDTIIPVLSEKLPHYKLPKRIVSVLALPRTSNGKIRRLSPEKLQLSEL